MSWERRSISRSRYSSNDSSEKKVPASLYLSWKVPAFLVLAALDEGEGSVSRSCLRWTVVAVRHGANGVGAANGTENGPLDERKGKGIVGVEGKDAGSNDEGD